MHGPYEVGKRYGYVDLSGEQPDYRFRSSEQNDALIGSSEQLKPEIDQIYLEVKSSGVHRITYEELREAGVNFGNTAAGELALAVNDRSIPILVRTNGDTQHFGAGAWIEFIAEPIESIYTDRTAYLLGINPRKAARVGYDR